MKNFIAVLALLTITSSAFAGSRSADRMSIYMVGNIAQKCPVQFADALKDKYILSLEIAETRNNDGQSVSTSKLSIGYPASPMGAEESVISIVTLVEVARKVQPLDGWLTDDTCSVKKVK